MEKSISFYLTYYRNFDIIFTERMRNMINIYIYVDDIREDDTFFKKLRNYTQMEWIPIVCKSAEEAIFFLNYYNEKKHIFIY